MYAHRMNNDMAVSPIVATLVLIVVAVIGAVAVGTIMGTFSSDVSKNTNADQAKTSSQTEVVVAGSTTVQPVAEEIAKVFMKDNPGIKITVQGGGSGAGVQAAALHLADIGTSSDLSKITAAQPSYPDLTPVQIGGSGVVVITNAATPAITGTVNNITRSELFALYTNGTNTGGDFTGTPVAYRRAESSGTEETFAKWITKGSQAQLTSLSTMTAPKAASGNAGILSAVQNNAGAIGFVDIGYALDANGNVVSGIKILGVQEDAVTATTVLPAAETVGSAYKFSKANVLAGTKDLLNGKSQGGVNTNYPQGLCRGLYYITNGPVSSTVKGFIDFSKGNGANDAIHAAGVFSNVDLSAF